MSNSNSSAISNGLQYLADRGWTELIDSRWTIDVREELERSGLGLAENETIEICNVAIVPKPDCNTKERLVLQIGLHDKTKSTHPLNTMLFRNIHFN